MQEEKKVEEEKPHFSISQLNTFNVCGERYRRRYICGDKIPPGIVLIVGSGVDGGVNANMREKIATKKLLPKEQVVDIAVAEFKKKWDTEGVDLMPEEKALGIKVAKGQGIDKTSRLAALHCDTFATEINPTHVQRKMKVILDGYPRDLLGYIDIQEGLLRVRDTKTKAKSMTQDDADKDDQMTMYAMMTKVIDKVIPDLCFDVLVDTKVPKRQALVTKRTEEDFKPILRRLENMILALDAGIFVPCPESFWGCNPKYCGYHSSCNFVKRPVHVAVKYDDNLK